ncbi:uncharacterized protein DS421_9g266900 [Arachis hypogaea]|nr:uncharacterized protein DS421_9g266900 [Arachis hypogaea]
MVVFVIVRSRRCNCLKEPSPLRSSLPPLEAAVPMQLLEVAFLRRTTAVSPHRLCFTYSPVLPRPAFRCSLTSVNM